MKKFNITLLALMAIAVISCGKSNSESTSEDENEREIEISQIPEAITAQIKANHPDAVIKEADEITLENGSKTYDVEVEENGRVVEYMYNAEGNYLGEEIDDDDEGDDDGDDD